jgi:hypothetical protein
MVHPTSLQTEKVSNQKLSPVLQKVIANLLPDQLSHLFISCYRKMKSEVWMIAVLNIEGQLPHASSSPLFSH